MVEILTGRRKFGCDVSLTIFACDLSAATDFTHEALRLFEGEPLTAENAHRLQDEKAHALLWHYICNLEKRLQEVSMVVIVIEKKN